MLKQSDARVAGVVSDDAHFVLTGGTVDALTDRVVSMLVETDLGTLTDPQALRAALTDVLEELIVVQEEIAEQGALLGETEKQLGALMRRYRALFDFAPDGYLLVDRSGVIEEANVAAATMLGHPAQRLAGRPLVLSVEAGHRSRWLNLLAEARRGDVHEAELTIVSRSGATLPVAVRLGAHRDDPQASLPCLLRDISRRRAAEQRLAEAAERQRQTAARLRETNAYKDAFLLAVSHDLRGPLSAIVLLAHLLADNPQQRPERLRRLAATIAANTARVERVQRDLLDLDRLARNAVVLVRRSIPLQSLVERAVAAADTADRPVRISVALQRARLDEAVVQRILDNLLSNAMTHTPAGTPVEVLVDMVPEGVLLSVVDHGPGIASERRRTLFTSLGHADPDEPPRHGGLGVGLHLVGRFAALHGGRVSVEETPGGGATFRVVLRDRP